MLSERGSETGGERSRARFGQVAGRIVLDKQKREEPGIGAGHDPGALTVDEIVDRRSDGTRARLRGFRRAKSPTNPRSELIV